MGRNDSTDIRSTRLSKISGKVIAGCIKLIGLTLKIDYKLPVAELERFKNKPLIYALWHNRLFVLPYAWKQCLSSRRVVALTSASKDGAVLEAAVNEFGVGVVRGSSSRRAVAALVALKKAVQAGSDAAITPDGPRGPKYKVQPGVVKLAQSTGSSILIMHADYHGVWTLGTWDGFMIPRPFSRVEVTLEIFPVPSEMTPEEFEMTRVQLEQRMIRKEY